MRVWIDITAPAHVLVFRPLVEIMRGRGDEVGDHRARTTRRRCELLELHGLEADGDRDATAGRSRLQEGAPDDESGFRPRRTAEVARSREFDVALAHGSHAADDLHRRLGIPSSTTFDYEFATLQHQLGCRAATRVVVPDAIPPERLKKYGVRPPKLVQYPGLKEEYYLSDFQPDRSLLDRFGVDRARVLVVLRPPPDVSLYHRHSNPLFPQTLEHLGRSEDVQAFVLPRTEEQREYVKGLALPSVIVPEDAVDAQSLIALADLVVSAGGTMNREAAALGVPVYTTYGGRLGGVDEELIRDGRLKPLTDPRALALTKRDPATAPRVRREPSEMLRLLLSALDA